MFWVLHQPIMPLIAVKINRFSKISGFSSFFDGFDQKKKAPNHRISSGDEETVTKLRKVIESRKRTKPSFIQQMYFLPKRNNYIPTNFGKTTPTETKNAFFGKCFLPKKDPLAGTDSFWTARALFPKAVMGRKIGCFGRKVFQKRVHKKGEKNYEEQQSDQHSPGS